MTRPLQAWPHADDFGWEAQADVDLLQGRRYLMRFCLKLVVVIVTTASLLACGSSPVTPPDPALPGTEMQRPETTQLLAALQRNGATAVAEIMPLRSMPFFSVPAVRVLVNAANVHVFEYASVSEVDAEAARVSADGSTVGTTQISWVSTPHFFAGIGSLCCM